MEVQRNNLSLGAKRTVGDVIKVAASNIIKMLAGFLVAFLLPKIIGITDYGYYKTFTLYSTYVGLFHFGFIDGIYLKYGGVDYNNLDRPTFRLFTRTLIVLEFIISISLLFFSITFLQNEHKFIFACLAIFLLFYNISTYYQFISQITSRFKELSFRNVLQSIFIGLSVIVLWMLQRFFNKQINYNIFTVLYVAIQAVLSFWYVWTYRDITFGSSIKFVKNVKVIVSLVWLGVPLLISNLCQTLLLSVDRQFVNVLFDTNTYAVYSFAYNMITLITTALSAISTVLYPSLKKIDEHNLRQYYPKLIGIVLIIVFACLLVYFPLIWFINWFLPKYSESLVIFRIILPSISASSAITIIMHNYYKALGLEKNFFVKSFCILILAVASNTLAYFIFRNTLAISVASIFVIIVWYLVTELYFVKKYRINFVKNFVYMLLLSLSFYLISSLDCWWKELVVYLFVFLGLTALFYSKDFDKTKTFFKKATEKEQHTENS